MTHDVQNSGETVEETRGLTRRQVALGAAWSVPVIALAAATPAAAASDPITVPTAVVGGTIGSTTAGTTRTVTYSGGYATYNNAGDAGISSGNYELSFSWNKPTLVPSFDLAAFTAQGWVVENAYTPGGVFFSFTHAPVSNGVVVTVPTVVWSGESTKPLLTVVLSSDSDDVTGSTVGIN
ncbi:hypothetical protein ACEXOS_014105 [Herbiconiux sp. P16]|uniref:hypothetical protein n=1 Tax=Herbiconiux wuyangfengii TaxID=3342794 RepID=UPI0035B98739